MSVSDLRLLYESIQKKILSFDETNLSWFISINIFKKEQVAYYIDICKHGLNERLRQSYRQVINDFRLIQDRLKLVTRQPLTGTYRIDFLNLDIPFKDLLKASCDESPLPAIEIKIASSIKKDGEYYILQELLSMSFADKQGEVNSLLKSADLEMFVAQFHELSRSGNDALISSNFQGEGGILSIALEFTPFSKLIETIFIAIIRIVTVVTVLAIGTFLVIEYELYSILVILLLGGWLLVFTLISMIPRDFSKIYKATIQLKNYGKQ